MTKNSTVIPTPIEIVEKLHAFQLRLVSSSLRALALYEAWSELNTESADRDLLVMSPVTKSIGVMWQATLDRLVLILMSTLDGHGSRSIHKTARVSFRVFQRLLDQPGVIEVLAGDARSQGRGERAKAQEQAVFDSADRLRRRLDQLDAEVPSRIKRLRAVRDRYIAHDLHLTTPLDPPIYQNLRTMTDEILLLAEDATRVLAPTVISWPRGEVAWQTKTLVETIAKR